MLQLDNELLISLALGLAETSSADMDSVIDQFLQTVGQAVGADRSYVFLIDQNTRTLSNSHEWCAPGVPSQRDEVQNAFLSTFSWTEKQLQAQRIVIIPEVSELGAEAQAEKEEFERQGIRSMIMVGLRADGALIGFFGFDSLHKSFEVSESSAVSFNRCGDLLSAAVARKLSSEGAYKLYQSLVTFADQFPGVIFQLRAFTDGTLNFPFMGSNVEEMFGVSPALLTRDGSALMGKVIKEDREHYFLEIEKSRRDLTPMHMSFRAENHHSRVLWIEVKAMPKRLADNSTLWHGYFFDITHQKQTAHRVHQQARRTRAILANIADGVLTTNSEGIIQTFNLAAETIFGYKASEVIGKCIGMLMSESQKSSQSGMLSTFQSQGSSRLLREMEGRRKSGEVFPAEVRVSRLDAGAKEVFIGVVTDITERKVSEKKIT